MKNVKKITSKDIILGISIFSLIVILSLIYLFSPYLFPKECQYINYEQKNILYEQPLDFYVINNYISEFEIKENIKFISTYLEDYEIKFYIRNITFLDDKNNQKVYSNFFDLETNLTEECGIINKQFEELISKERFEDNFIDIIYLEHKKGVIGRSCICGCNYAVLKKQTILLKSYDERNLFHEVGHLFGLIDQYDNQKNLMNDNMIVKLIYQPSCINLKQINLIKQNIESRSKL